MEDCSTDEQLQQETLCRRQWTDEYVERPESLMSKLSRLVCLFDRQEYSRSKRCFLLTDYANDWCEFR